MNKVTVKIANHEYTIVGEEKREYLLQLAAHVDEQIEATAKANPKLSQVMTAVLTSINIADQYYSQVKNNLEFKKTLSEPFKELEESQNQIKSLERVISLKDEELVKKDSKLEECRILINEKNKEKLMLNQEIDEKEIRLKEAEELVNDFQNRLYDLQLKMVELEEQIDNKNK